MAIEWSESFSTGVGWQDRQHKELFRRMNTLLDAMDLGHGKGEVAKTFAFLDDYVVVHFEAEEQAMNRYHYPGVIEHLSEHMGFIERVSALKKECEAAPKTAMVIKVKSIVVDWLINHIGDDDQRLGRFIREAEKKAWP